MIRVHIICSFLGTHPKVIFNELPGLAHGLGEILQGVGHLELILLLVLLIFQTHLFTCGTSLAREQQTPSCQL